MLCHIGAQKQQTVTDSELTGLEPDKPCFVFRLADGAGVTVNGTAIVGNDTYFSSQ